MSTNKSLLPIYYNHVVYSRPALIDPDLYPFLYVHRWLYQRGMPPRVNVRATEISRGKYRYTPLYLHRAVYLLSISEPDDRAKLTSDLELFLLRSKALDQVRFLDGDMLNCQYMNLSARRSARTESRRRRSRIDQHELEIAEQLSAEGRGLGPPVASDPSVPTAQFISPAASSPSLASPASAHSIDTEALLADVLTRLRLK